jgi:fructosamine-3-kinase
VSGISFEVRERHRTRGGCINDGHVVVDGERCFFVKTNRTDWHDMFEAEARSLLALADASAIRVPAPICHGRTHEHAYLVLEYIPLRGADDRTRTVLGRQLSAQHRIVGKRFGWHWQNRIGTTPQQNNQSNDWVSFWREQRLGFQFHLAATNGHNERLLAQGDRLLDRLPIFFDGHCPVPSLVHGDLWSGNFAAALTGEPVVYDPAVYFGDREADLAMTELFGGFGRPFMTAYQENWPLDPGYPTRRTLYNLYHVLNHLNLFGSGYLAQALGMIDTLLAETS